MKLKIKDRVQLYSAVVTGEVCQLEENKPLASMLAKIRDGGINELLLDDSLKSFAYGLISSFEKEGLIYNKQLTSMGMEVVESKKSWRCLKGQFKILYVQRDKECYIVDCKPYYENVLEKKLVQGQMMNFWKGQYSNNHGVIIKDVSFDANCYKSESPVEISMNCCYDYETDKNTYEIEFENKKYVFDENEFTFKIFNATGAKERLSEEVKVYGLQVINNEIVLNQYGNNPLIPNVIDDVFTKGFFNIEKDKFNIEGIKLSVNDYNITKKLLIDYLLRKAEIRYLGVDEVNALIPEFYSLFANCNEIKEGKKELYEDILFVAKENKSVAYLRLLAYKDLLPEENSRFYEVESQDFSKKSYSIMELASRMFGNSKDIVSIKIATKYACKNSRISRNALLLSKAIRKIYGCPLTVITYKDENASEDAKKQYVKLKNSADTVEFVEVARTQIERIHDRYVLVEKVDGNKLWFKMSSELDEIRFSGDFVNGELNPKVTENTESIIKELTFIKISEEGIIPEVKKLMEGK